MKKVKLIRVVNKSERYYEIFLFTTLFGDYCIERVYGATRNKSHTGLKKDYFSSFKEALVFYKSIIKSKQKRGYTFY